MVDISYPIDVQEALIQPKRGRGLEPEPNWRSMYENMKELYIELAGEVNEITSYTKRPLKETVKLIKDLREDIENFGGGLEG